MKFNRGFIYMNRKLAEYNKYIKGKKVALLGAGLSHREIIPQFVEKGAIVTLCDRKSFEDLGEYGEKLRALGVSFCLGNGYLSTLRDFDIVFRTPGIDYTKPEIQNALSAGVTLTSEMETFFDLCPSRTIGVTGSDGKTTTTTIIARSLETAGYTVHLGGNIGRPLLPIIDEVKPEDIAVVELSSFQLISMKTSPDISVVTNMAPNHLDHHKDMQEYIDAKRNILLHQSADDIAVLNYENEITRGMASDVKGTLRWFSKCRPIENGTYINENNHLIFCENGCESDIMDLMTIKLPGAHNRENVATAAAVVLTITGPEKFVNFVTDFCGVEHRIELTRIKDGVSWYNDSIGTSPTRTVAGLRSFDKKLILIAGGYDKKISYAPLAPEITERVKVLLVCGDTADKIVYEVEAIGYDLKELVIEKLENLEECVKRANELAKSGDVVLMSPASASFDRYPNFEVRGQHFKSLVAAL